MFLSVMRMLSYSSRFFLSSLSLLAFFSPQLWADKVVIIGTGVMGPSGKGVQNFRNSLRGSTSLIRSLQGPHPAEVPVWKAADVPYNRRQLYDEKLRCADITRFVVNKLDRHSLFAIHATDEALVDSGVMIQQIENGPWGLRPEPQEIGVYIGSSMPTQFDITSRLLPSGALKLLGKSDLMKHMPKAPSDASTLWGFENYTTCHTGACAASLHATISAIHALLAEAEIDGIKIMVAGGTEDPISPDGFRTRRDLLSPDGIPRPFDQFANGTALGAGAAVGVFTTEGYAKKMGYTAKARVAGYAMLSKIPPGPNGGHFKIESASIETVVRRALKNANILPHQIRGIYAHSPGTLECNVVEPIAFKAIFREDLANIPINSLASRIGHPLGPSGSFRLVAAVETLQDGFFPGNLFIENRAEGTGGLWLPGPEGVQLNDPKYILITNFALTGHYVALVLESVK